FKILSSSKRSSCVNVTLYLTMTFWGKGNNNIRYNQIDMTLVCTCKILTIIETIDNDRAAFLQPCRYLNFYSQKKEDKKCLLHPTVCFNRFAISAD
ncbi:MAG: hypothetical protein FWD66_05040, partial [Paludibacter sp.]|nr:hypothetical protein [Paludibacter sp.]